MKHFSPITQSLHDGNTNDVISVAEQKSGVLEAGPLEEPRNAIQWCFGELILFFKDAFEIKLVMQLKNGFVRKGFL